MYVSDEQRTADKSAMLQLWLELSVPFWILQIRREQWPFERRQERAQVAGRLIAEKADLLIRSATKKKHHETRADLINALAEGVACMAFQPGGIKVFGLKFEASLDG